MSLRDTAVTAIVLGLLPFILKHAYVGVLLWTWISIMNPHKLGWGFAVDMPFAAIVAGTTLIGLITTRDRVQLSFAIPVKILVAFLFWTCLTTAFAFDVELSMLQLEKVLKIQLMTLVAISVLHGRREIHLFIWLNVISLGFFGAKGGLFTILTGGEHRVWGPVDSFIAGNNEMALALIMVIPLMYYLRMTTENTWIRHGMVILMILSAAAALGSQSRGGFLAIAAMAVLLWWRSGHRAAFGVPLAIAAAALVLFMPDTWIQRMETIREYEQDASAIGRINAWWTMFNVANDRVLGGGFWTTSRELFLAYAPDPTLVKAAHSIYFQVLGEHGWIGLALFLGLWVAVWRAATALRQQAEGRPEFKWIVYLADMCQVSLLGYAVGGTFLSLAYFDLPYNILVIVVVIQRWLKERLAATAPPDREVPSQVVPTRAPQ